MVQFERIFEKIHIPTGEKREESPLKRISGAADIIYKRLGELERDESVPGMPKTSKEDRFFVFKEKEKEIKEQCRKISETETFLPDSDFLKGLLLASKLIELYKKSEDLESHRKYGGGKTDITVESSLCLAAQKGIAMFEQGIISGFPGEKDFLKKITSKEANMLFSAYHQIFSKDKVDLVGLIKIREFFDKYGSGLAEIIKKRGTNEEKYSYDYVQEKMSFLKNYVIFFKIGELYERKEDKASPAALQEEVVMDFLGKLIKKYGISGNDVAKSWLSNCYKDVSIRRTIEDNFKMMEQLEQKEPGVVQFLYRQFGIRNFKRYPIEALLRQYYEYKNKEKPYGIIIHPLNDWNGAFGMDKSIWESLYTQLQQQGYALRIMEAGGKVEFAKHLIRLDREYGEHHKISFAFIGGHGTKDSIQFGGAGEIHSLYTKDLAGKGVKRASRFFEENPTIILVSCSTGTMGGIGEKLSEVMGAQVIAPDVPTSILQTKVLKEGDSLRFEVKYTKEGSTKVFKRKKQ